MTRGEHLLDATVDVVAAGGFAAVSVRTVAAAAGVSAAQVQYYFRSKDELVAAAYRHVHNGLAHRARQVDLGGPARDALRRVLEVWLPLDDARVRDARVWLTFAAAAPFSATVQPLSAETERELISWLAQFLRTAQDRGELGTHLDAEVEAALLLAVLDGLVVQVLALPAAARADRIVTALDTYLDRLFAGHEGGR